VFALRLKGQPKAYPLDILDKKKVLNDTLGGVNLVILADAATRTARAYERGAHTFAPGSTPLSVVEQKNEEIWQVQEEQLVNTKTNERLPRLGGHVSYWFGWYAFYPKTEVYTAE
jgi:hypothetical protein